MVSKLPTKYFQEIQKFAPGPAAATSSSIIYTTSVGPDGRVIYHLFKGVPARYETLEGPVYGTQWVRGEDTYTIPPGAQPVNDFTAPWTQGNPNAHAQNDWARGTGRMGTGGGNDAAHGYQQGMPPAGPAHSFSNTPYTPHPYTAPLVYPPGHVKAGQPMPQSGAPSPIPGAYPWAGSPFEAYTPYPGATTPGGRPLSHSPASGGGGMGFGMPSYTGYSPAASVYPPGHVKEGQPMPQSRGPSPIPGAHPWAGPPFEAYPSYPSYPPAPTPGRQPTSHSPAAGGSSMGYGMPAFAGSGPVPLVYPPGHVKEGQPITYSRPPSPPPSAHPPTRPPSGSYPSNPASEFHQGPHHPHYAGPSTSYPQTPYPGYDNQPGTSSGAPGHPPSSLHPWSANHRTPEDEYYNLHRQFEGLHMRPEGASNGPFRHPDPTYSRPPTRAPSRSSLPRSNTPFLDPGGALVYPPGHVKEGQPVPRQRTPSPLPDLFGEPPFGRSPPSPMASAPGGPSSRGRPSPRGGPSPSTREPISVPREPVAQLAAPEGFSRNVNSRSPFTFFYTTKIQDMEYFWERVPRMPRVLADHDVMESDWDRLMKDMALAWAGKLPTLGPPQLRSDLVKDLVDTWNSLFFFKRGAELVLYQGKRRCSGPRAGLLERDLPDHEDPGDCPSSTSEDDSEDFDDAAYNYTGGPSALGDVFEEGRRRRQADRAMRRRERNRRRREKYREKKYSLYLTYVPPGEGLGESHAGPRMPGGFAGPSRGYDSDY